MQLPGKVITFFPVICRGRRTKLTASAGVTAVTGLLFIFWTWVVLRLLGTPTGIQ